MNAIEMHIVLSREREKRKKLLLVNISCCVLLHVIISIFSSVISAVFSTRPTLARSIAVARILANVNLLLSIVPLMFVISLFNLKGYQALKFRDGMRFLGYVIVLFVRLGVAVCANTGVVINISDLSCVPTVLELVSTIVEVRRDPHTAWRREIGFLMLTILLALGQGVTSVFLSFSQASHMQFLAAVLNVVLGFVALLITSVLCGWKKRREGNLAMKDHLRIVAYLVMFAVRCGLLIYAVIAVHFGLLIVTADVSFIPFILELCGIFYELRPTPLPTLALTPLHREIL